jgi:UDP-glucose 4-epimerase
MELKQGISFMCKDLVKAIRSSASIPDIGGEIFQIATSREHTVNEVSELIKAELEKQCNIKMEIAYGQPRQGDVNRNYADTTKAEQVLGWKSEMDLTKGIKLIVNWFNTIVIT